MMSERLRVHRVVQSVHRECGFHRCAHALLNPLADYATCPQISHTQAPWIPRANRGRSSAQATARYTVGRATAIRVAVFRAFGDEAVRDVGVGALVGASVLG